MPVQNLAPVQILQRSLGRRIREMRTQHGWTQEQFAEFCGLHRTYMGHVERGEKNVSLSTVARVANALGVGISALFGRTPEALPMNAPQKMRPPRVALSQSVMSHPDVKRLLSELQTQRRALRQAVRDLSSFRVNLESAS